MASPLSVSELLSSARELGSRLGRDEALCDSMLSASQQLLCELSSLHEADEALAELSADNLSVRKQLVRGIQLENRQLRQLSSENQELRACLEEHATATGLIMSKYRQQVQQLIGQSGLDLKSRPLQYQLEELQRSENKVLEMRQVMREAISLDEQRHAEFQEQLATLSTENMGLKEMLSIGQDYGSCPSQRNKMAKASQTEESLLSSRTPSFFGMLPRLLSQESMEEPNSQEDSHRNVGVRGGDAFGKINGEESEDVSSDNGSIAPVNGNEVNQEQDGVLPPHLSPQGDTCNRLMNSESECSDSDEEEHNASTATIKRGSNNSKTENELNNGSDYSMNDEMELQEGKELDGGDQEQCGSQDSQKDLECTESDSSSIGEAVKSSKNTDKEENSESESTTTTST